VGAPSALLYLRVTSVRERVEELWAQDVEIVSEPHVIFTHEDDTLGPTGTDEWMAFLTDSEGNTVGLVSHEPAAG
jgi:methylmalonyl-CoA/ethylmalonyl-CoA epimerase